MLTPTKKSKVTYKTFKREYLPFDFDEQKTNEKTILTNKDISDIQDFFKNKPKGGS